MDFKGIIIFSGILFILLILIVRFRREIVVLSIRMMYGKFSYEFYNIYKKSFIRSPFNYCFRDEFITHLLFILSKKEEIPSFNSGKEIYFENTPFFINYKDFLKKKGKPYCFNAFAFNQPDFVIKALGYHATIAGSNSILVFYFMNDSFFMGEYIFKKPKNDIKGSLTDHFLEIKDLPGDNFYIENTKDRIIHYQNTGFTVDIKYLSRENKAIIENLKQYYNKVTGKKLVLKT
jgi:hypothetical protein